MQNGWGKESHQNLATGVVPSGYIKAQYF